MEDVAALRMISITYRIATGAQAGRKVVTLQTLPGDDGPQEGGAASVRSHPNTPHAERNAMIEGLLAFGDGEVAGLGHAAIIAITDACVCQANAEIYVRVFRQRTGFGSFG